MTTWYYAREGQQFGPHTEEELKALLAGGKLASHELVWKAGMPGWAPAHTIFAPPLPAGGPPPPPPASSWAPPPAPQGTPGSTAQQVPQGLVAQRYPPQHGQPSSAPAYAAHGEQKERVAYILLGVFLGGFGVHNFYAGYVGRAVAQLLITLFLFWLIVPLIAVWIWTIVEVITVTADARGVPFR